MDLTKITTPFGLLDEATQKALRECGGPWERYLRGEWRDDPDDPCPVWTSDIAYRLKPQPPKPREFWLCAELDFPWVVLGEKPKNHWGQVIHVREIIE